MVDKEFNLMQFLLLKLHAINFVVNFKRHRHIKNICFKYFTPPKTLSGLLLPSVIVAGLWKCKPRVLPEAILHQSDDGCFCWIYPLWLNLMLCFFPSICISSSLTAWQLAVNSSFLFFSWLCLDHCVCVWMLTSGNTRQQGRPRRLVSRRHHSGDQRRQHRAHDTHGGSEQDQNLHSAAYTQHQQVWKHNT